ncbi:MAG: response regulator, partial [Verrucomicrobiales bacterium]|nr:response regulator [Verrucomicrobiales bacterium]
APGSAVSALVVDDVAANRDVLAEMLAGLGCSVESAENGPEALQRVLADPPDIVFLDIRMPGMTGVEAAQRLASEVARRGRTRPRLVAVSASALAHERQCCNRAEFDAFLAKPVRFEELCDCLGRLLPIRFGGGEPEPSPVHSEFRALPGGLHIPEPLRARLLLAAERFSATHLEAALAELAALGPPGQRTAEVLRHWLHAGRYSDITASLEHPEAPAQTSSAPPGPTP